MPTYIQTTANPTLKRKSLATEGEKGKSGWRRYHLIDDVDGVAEVGSLEPRGGERPEQPVKAEAGVVEVGAGDPREPRLV
jgi:hypothetical protein